MPRGIYEHKKGYKRPPFSAEWLENLNRSKIGRKQSAETIAKKTKSQTGQKRTEEYKAFMSNLRKGENNPMFGKTGDKCYKWKGGITPKNQVIRHSIEYRLWREAVFARDNWTCQTCSIKGVKLNSHHIKSFSDYPELRFAIDNGVTLCVGCHKKTDTYGVKKKK